MVSMVSLMRYRQEGQMSGKTKGVRAGSLIAASRMLMAKPGNNRRDKTDPHQHTPYSPMESSPA